MLLRNNLRAEVINTNIRVLKISNREGDWKKGARLIIFLPLLSRAMEQTYRGTSDVKGWVH